MSGGVDSSVAAGLLHEAGYEVVGVTMKTWDYETSLAGSGVSRAQSGCCSLDDMNDARAVAVKLGASHTVVDIRQEFGDWVVDRFAEDYLSGRTPNPCVLCNTHIKWAALMKRADALGCGHIATGHYANVRPEAGRWVVSRGLDATKDQSYVLWGVAQAHLARTLFPLGALPKTEIRRLAAEMGMEHVAGKKDSYEICFVPDDDYRGWLRRREPATADLAGGPMVWSETGETVGTHDGTPFYTVGQRRGLGRAFGEPAYVVRIEPETNTVVVGPRSALAASTLRASGAVWGKWDGLGSAGLGSAGLGSAGLGSAGLGSAGLGSAGLGSAGLGSAGLGAEVGLLGRIRHHDAGTPVVARQTAPDAFEAVFDRPRDAVAPGQAAVLYDGDDVVVGGWIDRPAAPRADESAEFIALPTL